MSLLDKNDKDLSISVAVCTRDRPEMLKVTLANLLKQSAGAGFELIVINNGVEAPVASVIHELDATDRIRLVTEDRPGIDHARNRALLEARGDVLLFADDDVTVLPGWIIAFEKAFIDPEVVGAGGRIFPLLPAEVGGWVRSLSRRIGGPPARYDFGKSEGLIDLKRQSAPFGGNMAVRVEAARSVGGFSDSFGYGRRRVPGEDTEIFARLVDDGGHLQYVPAATVFHRVPADKLSIEYFTGWWRGLGVSRVLVRRSGQGVSTATAPRLIESMRVLFKYSLRRIRRPRYSAKWLVAVERQQVALGEVLEGLRGVSGNAP